MAHTYATGWQETSENGVVVGSVLLALASLWRLAETSVEQLAIPFDLCYESPNLCTILALKAGHNVYSPGMYADLPFHITMYTPLYHYIAAALPHSTSNPFLTGRIVAMVFMLLAAATLFCAWRGKRMFAFPVLGLGLFFLVRPVVLNTAFLKNDSVGLAFAAWAVVCADRWHRTKTGLVLCALCCVAAVAAKQSFVASAGACLLFLWLQERRQGVAFALLLGSMGVASLFLAIAAWGRGFIFSVFLAPQNPMKLWNVWWEWRNMLVQPLFGFLCVVVIAALAGRLAAKRRWALRESPYFLYAACSWAVLFLTLGKLGAAKNYFIEPALASLLFLTHQGGTFARTRRGRALVPALVAVFVVLGLLELTYGNERGDSSFTNPQNIAWFPPLQDAIRKELAAKTTSSPPSILNLTDARAACLLDSPACVNDPYQYLFLWCDGKVDVQPLVDALQERRFDLVMLPTHRYAPLVAKEPPMARIVEAIESNYVQSATYIDVSCFVRPTDAAGPAPLGDREAGTPNPPAAEGGVTARPPQDPPE